MRQAGPALRPGLPPEASTLLHSEHQLQRQPERMLFDMLSSRPCAAIRPALTASLNPACLVGARSCTPPYLCCAGTPHAKR